MREIRKKLFPKMEAFRKDGKRAKLVKTKLSVDVKYCTMHPLHAQTDRNARRITLVETHSKFYSGILMVAFKKKIKKTPYNPVC